jgi:hypothetical protein
MVKKKRKKKSQLHLSPHRRSAGLHPVGAAVIGRDEKG